MRSAGVPVIAAKFGSIIDMPCELAYTSYESVAASYTTTQAFGSIGLPDTRVLSSVRRVTCAALAIAAAAAASSP